MIFRVVLSRQVIKTLVRLPRHVVDKLQTWARSVRLMGLEEMRKVPGYHDEPLKGARAGQRSVRLTRACRAIYVVRHDGTTEVAVVEEVNKHDY
jgi:proteic killer suppression protein